MNFIQVIETNYSFDRQNPNPYHSVIHATDAAQGAFALATNLPNVDEVFVKHRCALCGLVPERLHH